MIYDLQKAPFIKRLSAFLFDFIIWGVVAVGLAVLISAIVGYDDKLDALENAYLRYETEYGITLDISQEDYDKLTEAEKNQYFLAEEAMKDDILIANLYYIVMSLTLLIISIASLLSFALTELLVPAFFKNGQTLGKKVFSIGVMRTDGVKVTFFQLFVRAILGKHTVETMVPVLLLMMFFSGIVGIVGFGIAVLIVLLQIVFMIATHTNSAIHDLLAVTVVVDMNTQMIFESNEQMIEYKKKRAEQAALAKPY